MTVKKLMASLMCILVPLLYGCASIIHGTTQSVGIASNPSGAQVTINGESRGETPFIADLKRKNHHLVSIALDGYQPYETTLTRHVSGWVWGNIVFGGLIGLAVDAISGGLYKLTPEQIETELRESEALGALDADTLYLAVVLEPDPAWKHIGSLEPAP